MGALQCTKKASKYAIVLAPGSWEENCFTPWQADGVYPYNLLFDQNYFTTENTASIWYANVFTTLW